MSATVAIVGICAFLALACAAVVLELRISREKEEERLERQDRLMASVSDDPKELTRWVP